jgi:hypothetical protein
MIQTTKLSLPQVNLVARLRGCAILELVFQCSSHKLTRGIIDLKGPEFAFIIFEFNHYTTGQKDKIYFTIIIITITNLSIVS